MENEDKLISANKLKNFIDCCCTCGSKMGKAQLLIHEWFKDLIDGMPDENERLHGVWIKDGTWENGDDTYYCSICKRGIVTGSLDPTELFPFCHCGADMRKGGAK